MSRGALQKKNYKGLYDTKRGMQQIYQRELTCTMSIEWRFRVLIVMTSTKNKNSLLKHVP